MRGTLTGQPSPGHSLFPRRCHAGPAPALLLTVLAGPLAGQVFVRADDIGQGVLRPRGSECFLVTPRHVVGDATDVEYVNQGRVHGRARLELEYAPDIAVLRVSEGNPAACGSEWPAVQSLGERLQGTDEAVVESRGEDGSVQRRQVQVTGIDPVYLTVRPAGPGDGLFRGLSGSLVLVQRAHAGVLLSVDSESGEGVVLRMDHLANVLRGFFEAETAGSASYRIENTDITGIITERVTMRNEPDQRGEPLRTLDVGEPVTVTGRVVDRLWLRARIRDGTVGFIPTRAVQSL